MTGQFNNQHITVYLAALATAQPVSQAARDVIDERHRQITEEGWSIQHDDRHGLGQMAIAAACYALEAARPNWPYRLRASFAESIAIYWPWATAWFKPKDARADLVRAGALIIAEIERIDRQMAGQIVGTRAGLIIGDEHSESAHGAEFPLCRRPPSDWDPQS